MQPMVHGPGYRLGWVGAQRDVLAGDLTARADVGELASRPHCSALGPLAALAGEVTVIDGVPFVSTVAGGEAIVERSFACRACFLVYAEVPRWRWISVDGALSAVADLDPIVVRAAADAGIDPDAPFPFRCRGRAPAGTIHVLDKRDGLPHNPARHEAAKVHFELSHDDVESIGFRSVRHQGVFVPGGSSMHIHLTARGGRLAGHVDALQFNPGWGLALPAAATPEDQA